MKYLFSPFPTMDYRVSITFTDVFTFTMYKTQCQGIKSKDCIIIIIIADNTVDVGSSIDYNFTTARVLPPELAGNSVRRSITGRERPERRKLKIKH